VGEEEAFTSVLGVVEVVMVVVIGAVIIWEKKLEWKERGGAKVTTTTFVDRLVVTEVIAL